MTRKTPGAPKDGDYAAWLEQQRGAAAPAAPVPPADLEPTLDEEGPREQTLEDVLVRGEEPNEEFLERFRALEEAPELTDEEMERQALEAGGEDGDAGTPE